MVSEDQRMNELKKFSFAQTVTPDLCGKEPKMQPPAAFMLFQNAASLHAEVIGNGTAALAQRDCYWVATHSRIDFYEDAQLMDALTVSTLVNPAKPNADRVGRSQPRYGLCPLFRVRLP